MLYKVIMRTFQTIFCFFQSIKKKTNKQKVREILRGEIFLNHFDIIH